MKGNLGKTRRSAPIVPSAWSQGGVSVLLSNMKVWNYTQGIANQGSSPEPHCPK